MTAPSSRSGRIAEAAQRNPVAVVAGAGTLATGGVTTLIELLKAAHEISGTTGVIWQVTALVVTLLWTAASYASWQGRMAQQRRDASTQEAERVRQIYQDAAERAERREERTLGVVESAIVELKNGQAALTRGQEALTRGQETLAKVVAELTLEVRGRR